MGGASRARAACNAISGEAELASSVAMRKRGSGERQTGAPQVGMHLVRGLAAQLDGKLSQETPASGGSLFRIVIPRH